MIYLRQGDPGTLSALQDHDTGLARAGLSGGDAWQPADDRGLSMHIVWRWCLATWRNNDELTRFAEQVAPRFATNDAAGTLI